MSALIGLAIIFIILIIQSIFTKKQYEKKEYYFYKTKVVYKDNFIDISEKEVKFKYIREVTMRQTFFQRCFGLGTIILYTNAESGMGNGISISNVENVQAVYKEIKDIVKI